MSDAKKDYKVLQKKYDLPSLEELTREFGFKLNDSDAILQDIIESVIDTISNVSKTLESLVFVGSASSPSDLYQANMLNAKKQETFQFFKQLMSLYWKAKRIRLECKEKESANFIKAIYVKWIGKLKPKVIEIFTVFERKWNDTKLRDTSMGPMYHG